MNEYHADQFKQTRRVRMSAAPSQKSRLAGIALVLGLVAWMLPLLPAVVVLLAVTAWVTASQSPQSRRLAAGALALGLVGLSVQGVVGFRAYGLYQQLHAGPAAAMAHGTSGDLAGFLNGADPAQRDAAQHFLDELETRYGPLVQGTAVAAPPILEALAGHDTQATYRLEFRDAAVTAEARLLPADGATAWQWPAPRVVAWVRIDDPNHGPLVYPNLQTTEVEPDVLAP